MGGADLPHCFPNCPGMNYFGLIWAALARSRTRTALTLLSVVAAFLLFGLLDTVRVAFASAGSGVEGARRLVVMSRLSLTQFLPVGLERRIAAIPGVEATATGTWFGGVYQDARQFFANFSISETYLDLYPEYVIDPAQRRAFDADRRGAVVGRALAEQYGWTVGDVIPLQATIFPNHDGSNDWPLTLRAIFDITDPERKVDERLLFLHWEYFNEANAFITDLVGSVIVQLADPDQASAVAQAIDRMTDNSDHETRTRSEEAFRLTFARQVADVGLIVTSIMGAVFFTLLLLAGNTMTQAVRERIPELALLKTLGFTHLAVVWLVLAESLLLLIVGGVAGIGLARAAIPALNWAAGGLLPVTVIPAQTWALGLALMLLIGLVVGLPPALRALRLTIVDALAGR